MDRRRFLHDSAAASLGAVLLPLPMPTVEAPLLTRPIPSSGERIPVVGLGTWQTFDVGSNERERLQRAETLRAFVEAGGRVIDSSPMYGSSQAVVGDLVQSQGLRDRTWLATKVWTRGEAAGIQQMTESMALLRAPSIELMQVHNLVDWQAHLRTLRGWKEDGRVRYVGITHYVASAHDDVERVLRAESVDVVQLNLSLDEPEAADRVLGVCADRGVAFIANRPFGGGESFARARGKALPAWAAEYGITSWAQFMLKWILSHGEVTCAIPGTSRASHAVDNLGGAVGPIPDARGRGRMATAWRAL
jgi:diketogulonate reductase-like aldo/keto reductase